ncbi:MAG: VWA domain-containing protein [Oscillospiraceae bacterium]|nr:VWA domain-containing protein [Oscillospiraceae bacterium]MDY5736212.1 VWA domain-containing protein [Oscillospiraceae bacterium]
MGVTSSNKTLSTARIDCGGTFDVRLSLTAEPDITSNPADIVLILDRSGSMTGDPLASLKSGANKFIDIIDASTDGTQDGQIGGGSRIAVVSFSGTAVKDTQLITSVADLKSAVNALSAGGYTNHADAFTKASELLSGPSTNQKVMVMFTDGKTTAGVDPNPIATAAKAMGAVIYVIGLVGSDGIDEQALRDWASDPDSAYVVITPDDEDLEDIFEDLAKNISKPGATNIVINDMIDPCFRILSLSTPTKGTASLLNSTSLEWRIDELGTTASEGAVLEFTVQHIGSCSGLSEVNESISYRDDELNSVTFPSPSVDVDCGVDVLPEVCPEPVDLQITGCDDTVEFDAGELSMESLGRIVQMDVTLKNICPHRRVALAAILTEVDELGVEHQRGMKIMTIPAHTADRCRDITVRCIKFVLPEDLVEEDPTMLCRTRNLKARFISHYIDSGFDCCGEVF